LKASEKTLETILVVEDEPVVLGIVRAILERSGFRILTAGSGAEAIQLESVTKETIHLLLSDVMMPDLSGPAVATILKKLRPEMRVMLMSGYPDGGMLFLNHGWHFIEKPFRGTEIVSRLNEAIEAYKRRQAENSTSRIATLHFPGRDPLTRREREVLEKFTAGASNKEAGRQLGISPRTIEDHRANIMKKLGARNAADLVRIVMTASRHA